MFVRVQSAMLVAHHGKQLKDAYDKSKHASKAKRVKKSAKSVALFSLENPQCTVLFKLWACAEMFGFIAATLELLCGGGLQKFYRGQRAKQVWNHLRRFYGVLKRWRSNRSYGQR